VCESVLDGRTGLLADGFDDFVADIDRLLRQPRLRIALGLAGRAHARHYEWQRAVDDFEAVVRCAAELRSPRRSLVTQR
jgi:glycosyltransferase involved in cell wall biosynthesis